MPRHRRGRAARPRCRPARRARPGRAGDSGRRRGRRWAGAPRRTGPTTLGRPPVRGRPRRPAFSPPPADGVDRRELRELVRRGLVVERDGVWFAPAGRRRPPAAEVARLLAGSPEGVTVAQVRERLGTTRKYLMPLVAHLDATGRHPPPRRPAHRRPPPAAHRRLRAAERAFGPAGSGARRPPSGEGPLAARSSRTAGQLGHLHDVGHDLAEGVGVGQQPRVVALHDLALGADGRAQGVEGGPGDDVVLVAPEHDHRQLAPLELLELGRQVGGAGQVGHLPQRPGIADHVGEGVLEDHGQDLGDLAQRQDVPGKWMPQSHRGRSAMERTTLPEDDQADPPTELTRTR